MNRMDLSIGQRLGIGFGLVFLAVAGAWVTVIGLNKDGANAQDQYATVITRAERAQALERSVLEVGILARSVVVEPTASRLESFERSIVRARAHLDALAATPKESDGEALFAPMAESVRRYAQTAEEYVERRRAATPDAASEVLLTQVREALLEQMGLFLRLQHDKRNAAVARMAGARVELSRRFFVVGLSTLGALAVFGFLTYRSVRFPAMQLLRTAEALEDGDWGPARALAREPSETRDQPTRNEMMRIGAALGTAAVALENRELRLAADARIAQSVASSLDRKQLAEEALEHVVQHLGAEVGVLYWARDSKVLMPVASHALQGELVSVEIGEGIPGQAARGRKLVHVKDVPPDSGFQVRLGYDQAPVRSVAAVPLLFRGTLHGVLLVASLREFSNDALEFVNASAVQLSLGLHNVAAQEELEALVVNLRERNEAVRAQNETLQAQNEEIQAQSEEIHAQAEQLQVQQEELQAQNEELTQQSEELRRHSEVLLDADERKNQFLGVLAHELRNPMAPIMNSIFILKRAEPGSHSAERAQEIIERQASHLVRLIDDLLDVTRISEGKIHIRRESLELCEVLRGCVDDVSSALENAGLRVELALPDEPVEIEGDRTRLCQIIGNLLNNSIKYTDKGGFVRVSLTKDAARSAAVVEVKDNGIGMQGDFLPKLFQPFSQGHAAGLARTQGGLGLGLALVKALVSLHDGHVEAHSGGANRGSEFRVHLPLSGGDDGNGRHDDASYGIERSPTSLRKILVIEDNPDAAGSLREALEIDSYEVAVALSGSEGVRQALEFLPDVVLCDVGLPELDGYQVARELRANERTCSSILIAVTGYASEADKHRAYAAGFDLHLVKPLQVANFSRILDDLARTRNA